MMAAFQQMVEVQTATFEMQTKLLEKLPERRGGGGCGEREGKEKKHGSRLNPKVMTAVDKFKGGEAERVDWKFKFLNAVSTSSMSMRRVLT